MLKLVALVREEKGAPVKHIKKKAESKNAFRKDLKGNGYRIVVLMTRDEAIQLKEMDNNEIHTAKPIKNLSVKEQTLIHDYITQVL